MKRASGEAPVLWGSMIGFGRYSYRKESGHEGAQRIDNPAAFGLGHLPEGYVPYLAPQGTIHLFKDPRGASTFAPSALNEK